MLQTALQSTGQLIELLVDTLAVLIVALAAINATFHSLQIAFQKFGSEELRAIWLKFAGWILLALEFSLGADVIGSAFAPTWDAIGKLGAIAVIRTFLSFFLARDFADAKRLGSASAAIADS